MTKDNESELHALLERIIAPLERMAGCTTPLGDLTEAAAFIWQTNPDQLEPVEHVNCIPLKLLKGIDRVRDILLDNTRRFARGLPANNALLWGARGAGKSSLVKAVHAKLNEDGKEKLALIEIHREDVASLPRLMSFLRKHNQRCVVFCDDLSFSSDDTSYKSLKTVLEGGIEGRPGNVLFYATSNRRHLMPRDMMENERSTAINPSEAVDEKVSLSDRFGLWLGFHNCSQDDYLTMIHSYVDHFHLKINAATAEKEAIEWSTTRGARSGRVAWQYVQDLAGRLGQKLDV